MITVTIDSVDVTDKVQYPSLKINDNINQRRDTCSFKVKRLTGDSYTPDINQEIEVELDSTKIFGGVITAFTQTVESVDLLVYNVEATDYAQLLDRKLVLERFRNRTVEYIIDFILDKYDSEGFTMTNVSGSTVIGSITFNRLPISECIQKLADALNYSWYVDYDKDIHFFSKNDELAPFNITDTSKNYSWESLSISKDLTQMRNAVYVVGGLERGLERTEEFTASGDEDERKFYRLASKFAETPTVKVNTVEQSVGTENLADEESFDCMWDYNQKYIRFTDGNIPTASDEITVSGIPLFRVVGKVQSNTSVLENGIYEYVIEDRSIASREEARQRGEAELEAYKHGVIEAGFKTNTSGLKSGQVININSTLRDVNEDYIIQTVNFKMITQDFGEWRVELASQKTVGIIEFLQGLMKRKRSSEGESETLLTFQYIEDDATASDTLGTPAVTSPPYMWMSDDPSEDSTTESNNPTKTPIKWNFWTWES